MIISSTYFFSLAAFLQRFASSSLFHRFFSTLSLSHHFYSFLIILFALCMSLRLSKLRLPEENNCKKRNCNVRLHENPDSLCELSNYKDRSGKALRGARGRERESVENCAQNKRIFPHTYIIRFVIFVSLCRKK